MSNDRRRRAFSLLELLVVISIVALLIGLLLSAVQRVRARSAALACQDHLRQIRVALHGYHSTHQSLPPGITAQSGSREPYLGWQARLLPHIEQGALWEAAQAAYRADSWFLSPPHELVRTEFLAVYSCPSDPRMAPQSGPDRGKPGLTSYVGVEGRDQFRRDGVLFADSHVRLTDVTDGTSCTLMVAERPPSADLVFGWWYAGWGQSKDGSAEMILGAAEQIEYATFTHCPSNTTPFRPGQLSNQCDALHYWSLHVGGAHFALCDGSVRLIRYEAAPIMLALATRGGGEAVSVPD